jgi:predicted TIM-barrel fold metal-dependent hydrolase
MIDCHVHLLPDGLLGAVRRFFSEFITDRFAYPGDPWVVLDRHAEAGIGGVWNLPYAHKPGVAHEINVSMARLAEILSGHDVEIVRGATVHPLDPDPASDLRNASADLGAKVLKLHCSVGEYRPDHVGLGDVYEAAADLGVPVVIHVGVSIDGQTHDSDLVAFESAARRHPGTTFVVAHAAAPALEAMFSMMDRLPNAWVDLTPVVHRPIVAEPSVLERFSERVLFGSDAPNTAVELEGLLDWFDALGLSSGARQAILRDNAARLLS